MRNFSPRTDTQESLQQTAGQGLETSRIVEWLKAGTANIDKLKATVSTLITATVTTLTAAVGYIADLCGIVHKVTVTDTTVHAQFTYDTTIIVNKGTASTQTISTNNASTSGIVVTIVNIGAGVATVDFDGTANDPTLNQGCAAKFIWTGAVWEPLTAISGSNANGSWIKFPGGKMEQYGRPTFAQSAGSVTVTFPIAWAVNDYVISTGAENGTSASDCYVFMFNHTASSIDLYLRGAAWTGQANIVNWNAIGKWK